MTSIQHDQITRCHGTLCKLHFFLMIKMMLNDAKQVSRIWMIWTDVFQIYSVLLDHEIRAMMFLAHSWRSFSGGPSSLNSCIRSIGFSWHKLPGDPMGCDRWAVRMEWNAAIMFRLLDLAVNWLSQFRNMYFFSSSTRGREKDMCSYILSKQVAKQSSSYG